jgi:formate--tetrahydrofolate ligase
MTILLKDAIKPNLVQTIGGTPAFVHCGPFANIAHGCNSIIATRLARSYADYTVTEAGFGADLGAEKFLDIKCRLAKIKPDAVVVVATIRALKLHGGQDKTDLAVENLDTLRAGLPNLLRHVENIHNKFNLPCVVAINRFSSDTDSEIQLVKDTVAANFPDVNCILCDVWGKGGAGAVELADSVATLCDSENNFTLIYDDNDDIKTKIYKIATEIYGAKAVEYTEKAKASIARLEKLGCGGFPVVIAKTQYSFSDNPKLLGAPTGFTVKIRDVEPRTGAGFVVALAGAMLLMPGLPKTPAAVGMSIDQNEVIEGLY